MSIIQEEGEGTNVSLPSTRLYTVERSVWNVSHGWVSRGGVVKKGVKGGSSVGNKASHGHACLAARDTPSSRHLDHNFYSMSRRFVL